MPEEKSSAVKIADLICELVECAALRNAILPNFNEEEYNKLAQKLAQEILKLTK